jgi:predicted dehydrogenase
MNEVVTHSENGIVGAPASERVTGAEQLRGIGVVGLGYWGPNWVRNLYQARHAKRVVACDLDRDRRTHVQRMYPGVETTSHYDQLLEDRDIEAVVIATPVGTHYRLARQALESGKSVLVEKPLALSVSEAAGLVKLGRDVDRVLMVGHTFLYSAPVLKIREIVESGELGEILYISSTRANLGLFQHDVNVTWDLATHDISIILGIMQRLPESVSCQGQSHYNTDIEDVALLSIQFSGSVIAFIHVSWLDPNKIRRTTVVGSRKMLVYDDTSPQEKIRIYDRGVNMQRYYDNYGEFHFSYRYGDIRIPRVEDSEPLQKECAHFVECVRGNKQPQTDGVNGMQVVNILEAANRSMRCGQRIPIAHLDL